MVDREVDGPMTARSWGICWRSWAALVAYVGGLGPLSGPMWVVLGRYRGLCGWSWAAIGASVGGLGLQSGQRRRSCPKSGPGPSGSKVLGGPDRSARSAGPERSEAQYPFFQ